MNGIEHTNAGRSDEGAVALLVALLAVVLIGLLAFATDLGLAYTSKRQLQTASDGAALAAAKELADAALPGRSCAVVLTTATTKADSVARTYALDNAPAGSALAIGSAPSGWTGDAGVAFRCNPAGIAEVRVTSTNDSPTFFGGLFGANGYALSRPATAAMGPGTDFTGLRPFSFCKNVVDTLLANDPDLAGKAQLLTIDKVWNAQHPSGLATQACDGATTASGNWGVLGLDGSSNDPKNLTLWTDIGYNEPIDFSPGFVNFPGDPGFPSANAGQCTTADGCQHQVKTNGALNDILGRPSLFPVWDKVEKTKGTNNFRVIGVIAVKLCGWKLGNEWGTVPDPNFGGQSCYDSTTANVQIGTKNKDPDAFQVRLDRYIPIGELSSACGLTGGPAVCENNPRVTQLIE